MRKIANQPFGGPLVMEVNGSKISLGLGIAQKSRWRYLHLPPARISNQIYPIPSLNLG